MRIVPVSDVDDPRVADYHNLSDAVLLADRDRFIAEGILVITRLLREPRFSVDSLYFSEKGLRLLEQSGAEVPAEVPVYVSAQAVFDAVAGFPVHRGCLAAGPRDRVPSGERLIEALALQKGPSLVVLLEELANHDNIGGVFRNAAAFSADAVLLDPRCADPLYRKAVRVSMGHVFSVPFGRLGGGLKAALDRLHTAGFFSAALTPDPTARPLHALGSGLPERVALVLGAEGAGLSPEVLAVCRARVRIAMAAGIDSLNVATACGIALHGLQTARARIG